MKCAFDLYALLQGVNDGEVRIIKRLRKSTNWIHGTINCFIVQIESLCSALSQLLRYFAQFLLQKIGFLSQMSKTKWSVFSQRGNKFIQRFDTLVIKCTIYIGNIEYTCNPMNSYTVVCIEIRMHCVIKT